MVAQMSFEGTDWVEWICCTCERRIRLKDKKERGVKLMMLSGLIQILFFQSLGELISKLPLPSLPRPVIGLVLLLCWLMIKKEINPSLALVSEALSQYLGLLFVPAAVGVVLFLPQLKDNVFPIICGLIGSVVLTIGGSALALKLFNQGEASND